MTMTLSRPRSVDPVDDKPSPISSLCKQMCSPLYDMLTICISIADITTDVIVLISFYNKDRTTFFIISLTILILAQCSYAMAFVMRYETIDRNIFTCLAIFCCLLPFANCVAFCFYCTDDQESYVAKTFRKIGLRTGNTFRAEPTDSPLKKWMKEKLSKHFGFILEAGIEALPQSLLQMTAIVIFQETNYISIASIFLSMLSVCTKSLIFSQGIHFRVFIWTWLCIVTDFFGIFFAISWIFLNSDEFHTEHFLGYFNVIGEIWIWKTLLTSLPICTLGLLSWFFGFLWYLMYHEMHSAVDRFLTLTAGSLGVIVLACAGFIALEIVCFSFFAVAIYVLGTHRLRKFTNDANMNLLNIFISFIAHASAANAENDRMLRLIAINYGFGNYQNMPTLIEYITQRKAEGIHSLSNMTYADLRNNSDCRNKAMVYPKFIIEYSDPLTVILNKIEHANGLDLIKLYVVLVMNVFVQYILIPIFVICKLVQMSFAYIIIGYVSYYGLWNEIHSFQLSMLWVFVGFQLLLVVLFLSFVRKYWWLWHISPGCYPLLALANEVKQAKILQRTYGFYDDVVWLPKVKDILYDRFGGDIGSIIVHILMAMDILCIDDVKAEEVKLVMEEVQPDFDAT